MAAACVTVLAGSAAQAEIPVHPVMVYHDSWWEKSSNTGEALSLAQIPRSVDFVVLAFARPDMHYTTPLDLSGTGLEYKAPGPAIRDALVLLRRRNPKVRVLLSLGGSSYTGWDRLDEQAAARLVGDLGLDGVDIDFEPPNPQCRPGPSCASDPLWRDVVRRLRAVLPRPALLSVAGWSVGAYGQGRWQDAQPRSPWTGSMVTLLRSPEAAFIDVVSIEAYEAGPRYDPAEAFAAYRSLWPGTLLLGMEGPPASQNSPPATVTDAARLARIARDDAKGGVMVYAWLGSAAGGAIPAGQPLATAACKAMRKEC